MIVFGQGWAMEEAIARVRPNRHHTLSVRHAGRTPAYEVAIRLLRYFDIYTITTAFLTRRSKPQNRFGKNSSIRSFKSPFSCSMPSTRVRDSIAGLEWNVLTSCATSVISSLPSSSSRSRRRLTMARLSFSVPVTSPMLVFCL